MPLAPGMQRAIAIVETLKELTSQSDEASKCYNKFPRDIAKLILYGLEIPIIGLPNLTLEIAAKYLCIFHENTSQSSPDSDRPLYGLLHVGPPTNVIFFRNDLPPHIISYILAHELGHFMADVFFIRELWLKTLPEQKLVIDRAFTWQEFDVMLELQALIKGLPSRPSTITDRGRAVTSKIVEREIQADLIARELIAPWDMAVPLFRPNAQLEITLLLHKKFGLPKKIAWHYYNDLQNHLVPPSSTINRLFAPLLPSSS